MHNVIAQIPLPFPTTPFTEFLVRLAVWMAIAVVAYFVLTFVLRWIAHRLPGELDNALLGVTRKPLLLFCIAIGLNNTLRALRLPAEIDDPIQRRKAAENALSAWKNQGGTGQARQALQDAGVFTEQAG